MSQTGYSGQERDWRHFLPVCLLKDCKARQASQAVFWVCPGWLCVRVSSPKGLSPCPSGGSISVNGTSWC